MATCNRSRTAYRNFSDAIDAKRCKSPHHLEYLKVSRVGWVGLKSFRASNGQQLQSLMLSLRATCCTTRHLGFAQKICHFLEGEEVPWECIFWVCRIFLGAAGRGGAGWLCFGLLRLHAGFLKQCGPNVGHALTCTMISAHIDVVLLPRTRRRSTKLVLRSTLPPVTTDIGMFDGSPN